MLSTSCAQKLKVCETAGTPKPSLGASSMKLSPSPFLWCALLAYLGKTIVEASRIQ